MVTIMTCSDCNVNCKHYYISYKGNYDADKLKDLTTRLSKRYIVRLNGSEPLIHKDYLQSFEIAGQFGPLTNGLVFLNNYNYLDEIKKFNMKELYISYHFDLHDYISKVNKNFFEMFI